MHPVERNANIKRSDGMNNLGTLGWMPDDT